MERILKNERSQTAVDEIVKDVPVFTRYCQLHQPEYRVLQGLCIEFHAAWKLIKENWLVIRIYQEGVPTDDPLEQRYCRWDSQVAADSQKAARTIKWQHRIRQHAIGSNGPTCAVVIYFMIYLESSLSSRLISTKTNCKNPHFSRLQYRYKAKTSGECLNNSETLLLFH